MLNRNNSLAYQVFERLESDILSGKYKRGTILTELKLCEDLGVSRTPIREAVRRLEQEHIIETTDRGILVLSITLEDAEAIYAIRERIEGLAAAACARHATEEQIRDLADTVELQEFYTAKHDSEKIRKLDNEFHEKLYRYCGSVVYYDTLSPLHKKIQKIRKQSLENESRADNAIEEHKAVFQAIADHDPVAAEAAMNRHVTNAARHMKTRTPIEI